MSYLIACAVDKGDIQAVESMLRDGLNPNEPNGDKLLPIVLAIFRGNLRILRLLLNNGASVKVTDRDDRNLFHVLCESNSDYKTKVAMLNVLAAAGLDIKNSDGLKGRNLLHAAIKCGDYEMVRYAIKSGVSLTDLGYSYRDTHNSRNVYEQPLDMAEYLEDPTIYEYIKERVDAQEKASEDDVKFAGHKHKV